MERVSSGEAGRRIGVSQSTLRRWIEAGHLPALRTPGNRLLIEVSDLDRVLTPAGAQQKEEAR